MNSSLRKPCARWHVHGASFGGKLALTEGVLVGFSWEWSFEGVAGCLASLGRSHATIGFSLACAVALITRPLWAEAHPHKLFVTLSTTPVFIRMSFIDAEEVLENRSPGTGYKVKTDCKKFVLALTCF